MLQQTPEYKRLPLLRIHGNPHHIHGRRLSTKEFGFSAHNTPYAPAAYTKTEPNTSLCNAILAPSTACVGMYYDVPKNQQQLYNATPVELATTLWPPHKINYWFPNWKELFHGFIVVQKEKPLEDHVADSEQRYGIPCIQQQRSGSCPPCSGAQSLLPGANSEHQYLQGYTDDASLPTPMPFHDVANSLAMLKPMEKDQARTGLAKNACSSTSQAQSVVTKFSLKSPLWLPQGWITEFHTRRTGSTAGTRDKYFKHLVSGRRFRTRKDVLHFISTGKCRTRKQTRGKKVLMLSTRHPCMKTFAPKTLRIPEDWNPFSQSLLENKHSTHVANSLLRRPSEPSLNNGFGLPCKQLHSLCSSSSIQPPVKASTKERAHKVPVKKKAKTLPSKSGEDKQASKLWQWLTKPVAKDSSKPSDREVFTLSFSSSSVEKKVTEMTNQRNPSDMSLRNQTAQRTIQLSKELQAAHNGMVQMSREMQETAKKLSRQILVAQKDVEKGNQMQVSKVPTATCISLAGNTETGTYCRSEIDVVSRTTAFVKEASSNHPIETNHPPETTKFPRVNSCSTIDTDPRLRDTPDILNGQLLPQAATQWPEACSICLHVNKPSNNTMKHPEMKMTTIACAALENGTQEAKRHGPTELKHAIQPAQTDLVGTVQKQVVAIAHAPVQSEVYTVANGDLTRHATWPVAPMVHTHKLSQTACISSSSIIKEAERCASPYRAIMQSVDKMLGTDKEEAAEAHHAQAARTQTPFIVHLANVPVISNGKAMPLNGLYTAAMSEGKAGTLLYGAQLSRACSGSGTELQENDGQDTVRQQQMEDAEARHLRRKKFSAVLNPKLDLSRLNPSLTSRQRAKVVEKMKARHARELLASLGKHLCRKAVRRKP